MSGRALLLMALIGLAAIAGGAALLLGAGRRAAAPARYAARLAGVMAAAIGLILIVFAAAWTAPSRPVAIFGPTVPFPFAAPAVLT